ncbi:MAG: protein kinase [Chlamydiia bacterium]
MISSAPHSVNQGNDSPAAPKDSTSHCGRYVLRAVVGVAVVVSIVALAVFASPWTGGTSLAVGAFALCHVSTLLAPTVAACAGAVTIGGGVSLFFQSRGSQSSEGDSNDRGSVLAPTVAACAGAVATVGGGVSLFFQSRGSSVGSDDSRTGRKPCDEQFQSFKRIERAGNSSVGDRYKSDGGVEVRITMKLSGSPTSGVYIAKMQSAEVVIKVDFTDRGNLLRNEYNILNGIEKSPYILGWSTELFELNGFSGDSEAKVLCVAMEKCKRALGFTRVKDPGSPSHDLQMPALSSVKDVETVATALLHALAVLDKSGIVHRDIKPENILQRSDGSWVLADFGSACKEGTNLTKDAILHGMTDKYIAPEFFSKASSVDVSMGHEVDAWALGRTIYECFTAVQGSLPKMEELKQADKAKEWVESLGTVNKDSCPDRMPYDFKAGQMELESDYDHFTESPAWKVMLDLLTIDSGKRAHKLIEALGAFQRTSPQNRESRISV